MSDDSKTDISYVELKAELDSVLAKLQREDLDVDESLDLYKRGQELIKALEVYLDKAENTVKEIKAKFED